MSATNCKVGVLAQETLAADIRRLTVSWEDQRPEFMPHAGQFYMLRCWAADEAPVLSRPISVHDASTEHDTITFLYQVKGEGTQKLAALRPGDTLSLTGPCGNGFDTAAAAAAGRVAVVGGGIGVAPLLLNPTRWKPSCLTAGRSAWPPTPAPWATTGWSPASCTPKTSTWC